MKKKLIMRIFLATVFFVATFSASAQIYVKVRPTFPTIVRPPQPTPVYVWVNEEWKSNGNSYIYTGGYWEAPTQPGYYRTRGHWQTNKHGQRWVPGAWQSRINRGKKPKHIKKSKH